MIKDKKHKASNKKDLALRNVPVMLWHSTFASPLPLQKEQKKLAIGPKSNIQSRNFFAREKLQPNRKVSRVDP